MQQKDGRYYEVSGSSLREARRAIFLTQDALAERSGVTEATVSQIESGKRTQVRSGTLRALAQALEIEASDILQG